jgi:4-amino-4-deoxy-L-arabinose transferase-like glycosyltransferase
MKLSVPDMITRQPARAALLVITAALAVRLALGLSVGLGTDEIYTVAVSRQLSWSYFDHPPMHQWLTHASAALLGEGRQVRLPFIALFALTSWLMFLAAQRLAGAQAAFWSVVLLNLSAFFTLSAGSWVVPDGVLLAALSLMLWALARQFAPEPDERTGLGNWLAAGLALGLAGLSKYHGALVGVGLVVFLLAHPRGRRELATPGPWLAAAIALVLVAPVIVWNAQHGWASFLFQTGRTQGAGLTPWLAPASLAAQAGWLLPWVFAPLVLGLWQGFKAHRDVAFWLLVCLGLPTIALFTLTPIFGNIGLPHWAMPGWFLLMPLGGAALARLQADGAGRWLPSRWTPRVALGTLAVLALAASHAATGWIARLAPAVSRGDPTLELFGWDQLSARLAAAGLSRPGFIVADSWQNAGRMDVALGGETVVMPGTLDPRHYAFNLRQQGLLGRDALLVVRARREAMMREQIAPHFASLGASVPISLGRGGLREIELVAIPAAGFARPLPWAYGSRP